MESVEEAARAAFDAARAGKRVGVLASPTADITGHLQKLFAAVPMDDKADVERYRSFQAITLQWPNGGLLKIAKDAHTFRGLVLDRVFIPDLHTTEEYETVWPCLFFGGRDNRPELYPVEVIRQDAL